MMPLLCGYSVAIECDPIDDFFIGSVELEFALHRFSVHNFYFYSFGFCSDFPASFLYLISRYKSIYSIQCSLSNYKQNQIRYCFGIFRWIFSTLFMHPNQTKIKPFTRCNRFAVNWYSNMKPKTKLGQKTLCTFVMRFEWFLFSFCSVSVWSCCDKYPWYLLNRQCAPCANGSMFEMHWISQRKRQEKKLFIKYVHSPRVRLVLVSSSFSCPLSLPYRRRNGKFLFASSGTAHRRRTSKIQSNRPHK